MNSWLSSPCSRHTKRNLQLILDLNFVLVAFYFAHVLRYGSILPLEQFFLSSSVTYSLLISAPLIIIITKLPSVKLSTFDMTCAVRLALTSLFLGFIASTASYIFDVGSTKSIPAIFVILFFVLCLFGRLIVRELLFFIQKASLVTPVAIFGAGAAGIQLSSALRQSQEVRPVCFIDDNPSLYGLIVSGLRVFDRSDLKRMVNTGQVKRILLAIPSQDQTSVARIVSELSIFDIEIQVLPSFVDLISGKSREAVPVSPESLLGREKINLNLPEIELSYSNRVVMVTGAGGSIGSEICNQLLDCQPKKIVLFEQNEFALYNVEAALIPLLKNNNIELATCLGSICDKPRIEYVLNQEQVDVVLHAAANKHVPLVEKNEVQSIANNVLGTKILADAAIRNGVEKFILVSTDKAVRPTNVMGASKRMAELILQDLSTRSMKTKFSMVRFGNVLGSSGSVLPLFQKQIRLGGPVTVTHPEMTRYFMTIPEAARLVLLAGAYSQGGDLFVLDMGDPVKILDLAKRMIEISGGSTFSSANPNGIEIKITGLRPGEKLYEELLLDDSSLLSTPHKKILRADESRLSEIEVARMIKDLEIAIRDSNSLHVREIIKRYVDGYHQPYAEKVFV
jgi:FlaA1/EpsC-like NDP-sugar epimerase